MDENKKIETEVVEETSSEEVVESKPTIQAGIEAGLVDVEISKEVRNSFLDYAMSVIVSRAIPDVRDGFKPVHRRIIHGMNESGMQSDKPYKKCARIVGDVMGKYHPHGDAAIYSTLVRLAQPFSMRYTLVDGHGNFGSVDGDEAAAMRYTEARMSKLAAEMVKDINLNTVDFVDNYDGTEKEPSVLPARFPNLLVNGSAGIAVGMATNIPPHNLTEVINGVVAVARNPELTPTDIIRDYISGPDFPTGGTILGLQGIKDAYENGTGSITIRSKANIEEMNNGKKRIVVYELPYQVNKANLIEKIAHLVKDKVVEGITDIRDESNKEGIRVVIELRSDIIPEVMLNQLYKHSSLQVSFGIIFLSLHKSAPKVMNITEMLKNYIDHQVEVIERRTRFLLAKDEARDHIVIGLLKGISNIDKMVELIKNSETPEAASRALMDYFDLTEIQTNAILSMTLRRLTGLEEQKLQAERLDLQANIAKYNNILSSRENIIEVMIEELEEVKRRFGDDRKTEISNEIGTIEEESLIPEQEIVIVLTQNGYIKRMTTDTFRTQNRGGRGVKGATTSANDVVSVMLHTKTHTDLLLFSNLGKVYRIRAYRVPEGSRISKGVFAANLLDLEKGETIRSIIAIDEYLPEHHLFFATTGGIVKRTAVTEFQLIRKTGKIAITLKEGDELLDVKHTHGNCVVSLASSKGKMCSFYEEDVRPVGRSASGVLGMRIDDQTKIIGLTTSLEGELVLVVTSKGYGKMTYAKDYRMTKRGAKGVITLNTTAKNGEIISARAVNGDEDLMIITNNGVIIRISLAQVSVVGRNTQGVKVINVDTKSKVSSIAVVPHEEFVDEEFEGEENANEETLTEETPNE